MGLCTTGRVNFWRPVCTHHAMRINDTEICCSPTVTLSLRFNQGEFCNGLYVHRKAFAFAVFVGSGGLFERLSRGRNMLESQYKLVQTAML